jgi:molybdate transport system substrate-binding protein
MTGAISAGLIVSGTPQVFARNRLALVVPKDNRAEIQTPGDLARPGLKIVLATAAVPVGGYALATLGRLNQVYGATYSQTVLANVVSYEDNVKQVVAKVQLGEADAGIVYTSDVTPAAAAQLTKIEIPDEYNVVASYPIAPLKAASQAGLAADFVQLTVSDQGQAILQKWGFIGR